MTSLRTLFPLAAALALAAPVFAQKTYTAQSQMVDLNIAGGSSGNTYFIQGNIQWSFSGDCAGTPASRLVTTSATFTSRSCSGGGSNTGQPCNSANAPATPTPTDAEIVAALTAGGGANWSNAEKATFYCGGTITRTGTLQLTRTGLSGSGTWKFNYNVSASTDVLAAETCWTSETTTNGVNVNCNGFAAGESVAKKSSGSWTTKYSFSMQTTDPLTGLPVSRCQNTTAYLEIQDPITLAWSTAQSQPVDTSVVDGSQDFTYYGNAGQNGASQAIGLLHAPGRLAAALASDILLSDNFGGNDEAMTERSLMVPFSFNIASNPGSYRVRVQGTIKGNVGTVDAGFNVAESFNVIGAPNCQ